VKPQKWAQEKRTLGTTAGGSTYMITLPKAWIEGFSIKKGEELTLNLVGLGIYLGLDKKANSPAAATTKLKLGPDLQGEVLGRTLISRYIAGYNVIEVEGSVSSEQRKDLRRTAARLIGAEILQETSQNVLIHILRDPQVLSVEQLLEYIDDNVMGMVDDALKSLLTGNLDQAIGVVQRDERVDRFFLLMTRRLYAALHNPLAEVEHKISRVDFYNTHNVARQLERVADHAVRIAQATQALIEEQHPVPGKIEKLLKQAGEGVKELIEKVMEAFVQLNSQQAHQTLASVPKLAQLLEDMDRQLLELEDSHLAYHLGIVSDSINRIKDYAVNVAEVTLNAVALQVQ